MHPILFAYGAHKLFSFAFFYNVMIALCAVGFSLEMERQRWTVPKAPFFLRWLPDSLLNSIWFAGALIATTTVAIGVGGAHLFFSIITSVEQGWGHGLGIDGWAYLLVTNTYDSMWFGGFLAGMLWCWYLARRCKVPYLRFLDVAVLYAVLGQVPGRIGCFLAGCCYGKPTTMPWGMKYESASSLMHFPHGTVLHPSHFYEIAVAAVLFTYMYRKHRHNAFDGQTVIRYFIWGGLARVVTEIFRYDTPRGLIWPWMTYSQGVGLALAVAGVIMHFSLRKKARKASPALSPA